jgi:hypothetical protein
MIQSGKKTIEFNSDITNNNRTTSSYNINKIKRNVNSEKSNSYSFVYKSKIYINNSSNNNKDKITKNNKNYKKMRIFSTPVIHNNAINFKKMLSRKYVNRVIHNDKIGAGSPLNPKYNLIFPKTVMKVKYTKKTNKSNKKEFKGLIGEFLHEINYNKMSKYNTIQHFSNFSKMFGRGTRIDSNFPIFMNNVNTRNAFDLNTEKSLRMNYFSSGKLNNPFSSFNTKKSFNKIISNNLNKNKNNSKVNNLKNKENRMKYYNNNLNNIFKKVIFDDIVDNNESKCKQNVDLFDLKKNPRLVKKINMSYKNLISDYYRFNLDFLDKDSIKDKIDGVTFEIIKKSKQA